MLVSAFDLEPGQRGNPASEYWLTVSNVILDGSFTFQINFHIPSTEKESIDFIDIDNRRLIGQLRLERPDGSPFERFVVSHDSFGFQTILSARFILFPGGTLTVVLRTPVVPTPGDRGPSIKGYVTLGLPAYRGAGFPDIQPPATVLLWARGVTDIPIASGRAENVIHSDGPFNLPAGGVEKYAALLRDKNTDFKGIRGALDLADQEKVPALIDLLSATARSDEVEALNKMLAEMGIDVEVKRKK
jgi:hypothetical protein